MIENLDPIKHTDNLFDNNGFITNVACGRVVISKVNELIDAVNELQAKVNKLEAKVNFVKPEVKETFVCPEQYKWVGKLCKFWDYAGKPVYGILDDVDVDKIEYPYTKFGGCIYQNCEPVKPDDDIIYKGE